MTVLGLKLSRRANAVSALHGEVSREMWAGLQLGQDRDESVAHRAHHQRRARSDVAGAADVPPLRPPSGNRLARTQRRGQDLGGNRKRRRRRALGNAPEPEVAASRIRAPARHGTGRTPRRSARDHPAAGPRAESRRAHDRIRAALCHLQAGQPDSGGYREAGADGERPEAARAVRLRGQSASAR